MIADTIDSRTVGQSSRRPVDIITPRCYVPTQLRVQGDIVGFEVYDYRNGIRNVLVTP